MTNSVHVGGYYSKHLPIPLKLYNLYYKSHG